MNQEIERLCFLQDQLRDLAHQMRHEAMSGQHDGWSAALARRVDMLTVMHNRARGAVAKTPPNFVALLEPAALRAEEARAQLDSVYGIVLRIKMAEDVRLRRQTDVPSAMSSRSGHGQTVHAFLGTDHCAIRGLLPGLPPRTPDSEPVGA